MMVYVVTRADSYDVLELVAAFRTRAEAELFRDEKANPQLLRQLTDLVKYGDMRGFIQDEFLVHEVELAH